jgi:hypothetical protein
MLFQKFLLLIYSPLKLCPLYLYRFIPYYKLLQENGWVLVVIFSPACPKLCENAVNLVFSSIKDLAAAQREEILRERKIKEVAILAVLAKGGWKALRTAKN